LENEEVAYNRCKEDFELGKVVKYDGVITDFVPENPDIFMSFEEFTRYRKETSSELATAFDELMEQPQEEGVEETPEIMSALKEIKVGNKSANLSSDWDRMTPYWKWVIQLYAHDIIERFGGLSIVDEGLLPIGMVSMFKSKRVRWQG